MGDPSRARVTRPLRLYARGSSRSWPGEADRDRAGVLLGFLHVEG